MKDLFDGLKSNELYTPTTEALYQRFCTVCENVGECAARISEASSAAATPTTGVIYVECPLVVDKLVTERILDRVALTLARRAGASILEYKTCDGCVYYRPSDSISQETVPSCREAEEALLRHESVLPRNYTPGHKKSRRNSGA